MASSDSSLSWWRWSSCKSCCVLCARKLRDKRPKISKKIGKIYFASFWAAFSSSFAITMMFPFLPFMVELLLPWLLENEELVATYTGIVASAMFFGRVFSSYIWGAIADRKGRKPVILVSLVLMGLSSAIFGFSVNYSMAVIMRFFVGFTNGALGNVKAVVSEVSDDSSQAFGVSLVGASFGLGIIVGPAVSGAISDPIGQYNLTIENYVVREFLTRFPYSLPCLVNMIICFLSAVIFYFLVPETLGMKKNRRRSEISQRDIEIAREKADVSTSKLETAEPDDSESAALISNDVLQETTEHAHENASSNNTTDLSEGSGTSTEQMVESPKETSTVNLPYELPQNDLSSVSKDLSDQSDPVGTDPSNCENGGVFVSLSESEGCQERKNGAVEEEGVALMGMGGRRLSWARMPSQKAVKSSVRNHCIYLKDKVVALSVLIYCTFSFALIAWNEVLPVWAKTSPHLGGLDFSLGEIGLALTISGVIYFPFSLFFFPLLESKFGSVKTVYGALTVLVLTTTLFPNIHYLIAWRGLLWFLLCLALSVNQIAIGLAVTGSILFVNNSVTFDKLGAINGLAMTLTSIGRTFSPLVGGGLFTLGLSATLSGFSFPLDYRLVFLVIGFTYFLCVLLVACLPLSINKQKIIEDLEPEE